MPNYDPKISKIFFSLTGADENGHKLAKDGVDHQVIKYNVALADTYKKDVRELKESRQITVKVDQTQQKEKEELVGG